MGTIHANIAQRAAETRADCRAGIDLLRRRVSLLAGKDRLMMTMYLENGNTFRQIARLSGVSEANIARRIRKLTKQLIDGEYVRCLRERHRLSKTEMAVAKEYFLQDLRLKDIAVRHRCSVYRVRKILQRVRQRISEQETVSPQAGEKAQEDYVDIQRFQDLCLG